MSSEDRSNDGTTSEGVEARRRVMRTFVIPLGGVVCVLGLAGGLLSIENWRGESRWDRHLAEMKKRGESLNWDDFIPKPVPDDKNLAKTPLLEEIGHRLKTDREVLTQFTRLHPEFAEGNWMRGGMLDFAGWLDEIERREKLVLPRSSGIPSRDVLEVLREIEPDLDELRVAVRNRPEARYASDYSDLMGADSPNFVALRVLSQLAALHGSASLAEGNVEAAFTDWQIIHGLAGSMKNEPRVVAAMIRTTMIAGPELQVFWEGWAQSRWTREHYVAMQSKFREIDLAAGLSLAIRAGERAALNRALEQAGYSMKSLFGHAKGFDPTDLMPRGWSIRNLIEYNEIIQMVLDAGFKSGPTRLDPGKLIAAWSAVEKKIERVSPYSVMVRMALPNVSRAYQMAARAQTLVDEAGLVCALERYRFEKGVYPDSLEALVPDFVEALPVDLIAGHSLIYRLEGGDRFRLYSVGWNETDEGGKAPLTDDWADGDWLWPGKKP